MAGNEQGLLQGWNSLLVCPEPLLIKNIKVQVNKQKPSNACPAQLMLIAIKCQLIQRHARLAANPMLAACSFSCCCQYASFKVSPSTNLPFENEIGIISLADIPQVCPSLNVTL